MLRWPRHDDAPMPMAVRETLLAFRDQIYARLAERIEHVTLFGSFARGEAHEDSDVDVLVLLDRAEDADKKLVSDIASDVSTSGYQLLVQPLVMATSDFERWLTGTRRTPHEILSDGIPLSPPRGPR